MPRTDVFIGPIFYNAYRARPLVLVDGGARGGIPQRWRQAMPYLSVIGFEPDPRSYARLMAEAPPQVQYLNIGLGAEARTVELHQAREEGDSSLLIPNLEFLRRFPNPERFEVISSTQIQVDSLDRILMANQIEDVSFVKLDTQGTEFYILQGAERTLAESILGLELEVEFSPMYVGQPLFADLDGFVRPFGFELFDLCQIYWKRNTAPKWKQAKGQIIYADVLYLSSLKRVEELVWKLGNEESRRARVLHLLSICLIYRYFDYALEIAHNFMNLFSEAENEIISAALIKNDEPPASTVAVTANLPAPSSFKSRAKRKLAALLGLHRKSVAPSTTPLAPPNWRHFGSGSTIGNPEV